MHLDKQKFPFRFRKLFLSHLLFKHPWGRRMGGNNTIKKKSKTIWKLKMIIMSVLCPPSSLPPSTYLPSPQLSLRIHNGPVDKAIQLLLIHFLTENKIAFSINSLKEKILIFLLHLRCAEINIKNWLKGGGVVLIF